jgi:hypothetical protein
MDELDLLKEALAKPGPSSDTVRQGRDDLEQLIRRQSRTRARRPGRRIAGVGLTAAAVAVAVTAAVLFTSGAPRTRPGAPVHSTAMRHHPATANMRHHPATAKQSAQQILLTAAASADRAPAGSGTYWYVRVRAATGNGTKLYLAESWTRRDGQTWIRDNKTGPPIQLPRSPLTLGPFFLGGRELRFRQIQHLPADPAALTKWIVTNAARHGGKSGGPVPSKAQEREDIFDSLISLLSELPATPQVRAAAFRALAALPGVTSLGQADGGQGVRFTLLGGHQATLIIDPASGQIRATNFFVDNQGGEFWQKIPNATITGRWTDKLP